MIGKSSFSVEMKLVRFMDMNVAHDFYANGLSNDFILEPTPDTLKIFNQLGVIFKVQKFGFSLFCNAAKANTVIQYLKAPKAFRFYIIKKNSTFLNFSDTLVDNFNAIYYIGSSLAKKEGNELSLNPIDFFAKRENSIPIIQTGSKINITDNVKYNSVAKIFDSYGALLGEVKHNSDENDSSLLIIKGNQLIFNSSHLDEGKYIIEYDGNRSIAFCVFPIVPPHLYSILEMDLFARKSKKNAFSITKENKFIYQKLSLKLAARESYWKYYLVDKRKGCKDIIDVEIEEAGKSIKISKPKLEKLTNGMEALVFHFVKPKKLKNIESSLKDRLSLRFKRKGKGKIEEINPLKLPKPSANTRITFENKKPFSVIFYNI